MPGSITLGVGQTVLITSTFRYPDNSLAPGEPEDWVSSNPAVATVAQEANISTITAISPGSASVSATWQTLTDSVAVTVVAVAPTSLRLTLGNPAGP
jgi:uncharacterized protein YjdB